MLVLSEPLCLVDPTQHSAQVSARLFPESAEGVPGLVSPLVSKTSLNICCVPRTGA